MSDDKSKEKGPTYSENAVTSDVDLKSWCKHNKIKFNVVDLINLESLKEDYGYVFTGSSKNEANEGNVHHWLAVVGDEVFDSYGLEDYKLPDNYRFMKHTPRQLQHYSSNVCGEYCSLLLLLASKNEQEQGSNLAQEFITKYKLGNNQTHNDRIILNNFSSLAPKSIAKRIEETDKNESGGSMRDDRIFLPNGASDRRAPFTEPSETNQETAANTDEVSGTGINSEIDDGTV